MWEWLLSQKSLQCGESTVIPLIATHGFVVCTYPSKRNELCSTHIHAYVLGFLWGDIKRASLEMNGKQALVKYIAIS